MSYTSLPYPKFDAGAWPTITQEMVDIQKKNREEWIAQLRNGKYKQTKHRLHSSDGFCCLGVLCDITNSNGWKLSTTVPPASTFEDVSAMTPSKMRAFEFGLRKSNGLFEPDEAFLKVFPKVAQCRAWNDFRQVALTDLNDEGFSFGEIADIIEYGPPKLLHAVGDRV